MHHYPITVQHIFCNSYNLINADEFARVLTSNVKGIYCGHYHVGCFSLFANIPCWVSPSVAPQFDTNDIVNDSNFYLLLTPPAFTMHQFDSDGINNSRIVFCADKAEKSKVS